MPITIGSNIAALQAQRRLNEGGDALSRVYERLSSGLRINHASDDPAGLAMASGLRSSAQVFGQAVRNVNDGISLMQVAQSALEQLSEIVTRQQELAAQAANDTFSSSQRTALNTEANALVSEYNRIVQTTQFNGIRPLDGSSSSLQIQAGQGGSSVINIDLSLASVSASTSTTVGTGAFATSISFGSRTGPLAVVDLDGDGNADVVSASPFDNDLNVVLSNGNGTFKAIVSYRLQGTPPDLATGDLDGDGDIDLVAGYSSAPGYVKVLLNNGNGSFAASVSYNAPAAGVSTLLLDLNNDNILDLVMPSGTYLNVFIGNGNGTFQATNTSYSIGSANAVQAVSGDANGDGFLDVFVSTNYADGVSVMLSNGNGTFKARITSFANGSRSFLEAADFNGDSKLDLVAVNAVGNTTISLGNGNGTFQGETAFTSSINREMSAGDYNGDGLIDLAGISYSTNSLAIVLGNGNGTFQAPTTVASGLRPTNLAKGDLNGDGVADIVTSDYGFNIHFAATTTSSTGSSTSALSLVMGALDLTTTSSAAAALSTLATQQTLVSDTLGMVGAYESRLDIALSHLEAMRTTTLEAEARIENVDVAEETAAMVREKILQQSRTAILAQANLQPAIALALLNSHA